MPFRFLPSFYSSLPSPQPPLLFFLFFLSLPTATLQQQQFQTKKIAPFMFSTKAEPQLCSAHSQSVNCSQKHHTMFIYLFPCLRFVGQQEGVSEKGEGENGRTIEQETMRDRDLQEVRRNWLACVRANVIILAIKWSPRLKEVSLSVSLIVWARERARSCQQLLKSDRQQRRQSELVLTENKTDGRVRDTVRRNMVAETYQIDGADTIPARQTQ